MLRNGKHSNRHLQNSWDKYGEDSFNFVIIETCDPDFVIDREQFYLDSERPFDPLVGLNNSPTATTRKGFKHSEETKALLSRRGKQRKHPHLLAYAASLKGTVSPRRGISWGTWSIEERAKMSESRKGQIAWNAGIPMRDDVKTRVSKSVSKNRRVYGPEVRAKICELRAAKTTYSKIASLTGVSLPNCHRIFSADQPASTTLP
jgi:group I intron endonuclease